MFRVETTARRSARPDGGLAGEGDDYTLDVLVAPGDGTPLAVRVTADGLTLRRPGPAGGPARLLPWRDVRRLLADGLPPPPCRYGVVIDGELGPVFGDRGDACNRAASARLDGAAAAVIRVPSR